jgi:hypothetical protein
VSLHPAQTGSPLSASLITGFDVVLAAVLVLAFGAATLRARQRRGGVASTPADD